jgi:hypothetical protein
MPATPSAGTTRTIQFAFRPWVRSTCRKAMLWGTGVIVLLAGVAWFLRDPSEGVFGKAFTVLLGYTVLFQASLLKIWWTAGGPAIEIDGESLAYQPLQYFRPRRILFNRVLSCGPRPGTESYRFVIDDRERGRERELFLNLAVVRDKHALLELLGGGLERAGLERRGDDWGRPRPADAADRTQSGAG